MSIDPTSPPINVTDQVSSPTSIIVRWEEVPPIDQNGIINGYELIYNPLDAFEGSLTPVSINLPASSRGTTLSGLQEYVRYNISVRALTSVGPGPFSTPLTSVTDEACKSVIASIIIPLLPSLVTTTTITITAPASAPQNVRAIALSSIELYVTWEEVPPIDQNGIISTYEVLSVPQMTFGGALTQNTINVTNMFLLLKDLHPFVTYNISVKAYTMAGAGPYGMAVNTTLEDRKLHIYPFSVFFSQCSLPSQGLLARQWISLLTPCHPPPYVCPGRGSLHLIKMA